MTTRAGQRARESFLDKGFVSPKRDLLPHTHDLNRNPLRRCLWFSEEPGISLVVAEGNLASYRAGGVRGATVPLSP